MTNIIETLPEVETFTLAPQDFDTTPVEEVEVVGFVQDKADEEAVDAEALAPVI